MSLIFFLSCCILKSRTKDFDYIRTVSYQLIYTLVGCHVINIEKIGQTILMGITHFINHNTNMLP